MSQISIMINGRDYSIVCDDGQEKHLTRLSEYLDRRVTELVTSVGQIGDARLLLMVGLLIADELSDAYAELAVARGEASDETIARMRSNEKIGFSGGEDATVTALDSLSERVEAIAARLEEA